MAIYIYKPTLPRVASPPSPLPRKGGLGGVYDAEHPPSTPPYGGRGKGGKGGERLRRARFNASAGAFSVFEAPPQV